MPFDYYTWVNDNSTNENTWFGVFQSLTLYIKNPKEIHLDSVQTSSTTLSNKSRIEWVLETGMVYMGFVERSFGVSCIRKDIYPTKGPRFQISFDTAFTPDILISPTLQEVNEDSLIISSNKKDRFNKLSFEEHFLSNSLESNLYKHLDNNSRIKETGRYDLLNAKVDCLSLGLMPGRRVAAIRWEGVAEGVCYQTEPIQKFIRSEQSNSKITTK